jgi:hypothetical protein
MPWMMLKHLVQCHGHRGIGIERRVMKGSLYMWVVSSWNAAAGIGVARA